MPFNTNVFNGLCSVFIQPLSPSGEALATLGMYAEGYVSLEQNIVMPDHVAMRGLCLLLNK